MLGFNLILLVEKARIHVIQRDGFNLLFLESIMAVLEIEEPEC